MHDVTHYAWLQGDADATSVASLRGQNGDLAVWRAETPHEQAMAAKTGPASTAVHVTANHGRWIVECPDCQDAQLAARDDKRFMCVGCANAAVDGVWRPVIWPKNHEDIEAILEERPHDRHKNWAPGETIEDLIAEAASVEEPTDVRAHAIWAGLSPEAAEQWAAECNAAAEWIRAVEEETD